MIRQWEYKSKKVAMYTANRLFEENDYVVILKSGESYWIELVPPILSKNERLVKIFERNQSYV